MDDSVSGTIYFLPPWHVVTYVTRPLISLISLMSAANTVTDGRTAPCDSPFSACVFCSGLNWSDVERLMWLDEIFLVTFAVGARVYVFCFVHTPAWRAALEPWADSRGCQTLTDTSHVADRTRTIQICKSHKTLGGTRILSGACQRLSRLSFRLRCVPPLLLTSATVMFGLTVIAGWSVSCSSAHISFMQEKHFKEKDAKIRKITMTTTIIT